MLCKCHQVCFKLQPSVIRTLTPSEQQQPLGILYYVEWGKFSHHFLHITPFHDSISESCFAIASNLEVSIA